MVSFFLYLKKYLPFIWQVIDFCNGKLVYLFFGEKINTEIKKQNSIQEKIALFEYEFLKENHISLLSNFLKSQPKMDAFFEAHAFDERTLRKLLSNPSFKMMGVFSDEKLVGYYFMRFFINKYCFIGRIVDKNYQRLGIASSMSKIMYPVALNNGFRCFATLSEKNTSIKKLHEKEGNYRIVKKLPEEDYVLIEILAEL